MTRDELKTHMIELADALPGVTMVTRGLSVKVESDGRVVIDEDDLLSGVRADGNLMLREEQESQCFECPGQGKGLMDL